MSDENFETLVQFGRNLLNGTDVLESHRDFVKWDNLVAEWLEKNYPNIGLSAEWSSLPNSPLMIGGAYYNYPNTWALFYKVVQKRLKWLSSFKGAIIEAENLAKVKTNKEKKLNKNIFIIHGHDELNLLRLKNIIKEKWKLNPIILFSKAGKGRTLIEKFEEEAMNCSYAFALFTPDDIVITDKKEYPQSRPNVIFELGWFYGKLGRERVCILFKKGTKIHSDLNGISRIEFTESIDEKVNDIEEELRACGLIN